MDSVLSVLETIDSWLWGKWLLFVLVGVGIFYTILTKGVQIRHFGFIAKKTFFSKRKDDESCENGNVSSKQSLWMAIASCVGSGNIVGVSTAVIAGGLGAIFWMWVAAFVGMATKYGEIVLGIKYRQKDENGRYFGGPMYYIEHGVGSKLLASLCAVFMVTQIIGGNFIQSNTISGVLSSNFSIPASITGIILSIVIFIIAVGGLKRLAHVAQRLVPIMASIYVIGGLIIILINITKIPAVFAEILESAFGLRAVAGGALGSMMIAMEKGVARGLYSNEAGEGSAPVLHSAADVSHPAEQGITGVMEVFIDTFVICTISGLVIGVTGILDSGLPGSVLVLNAFKRVWEPLGYIVLVSLLLFCTTTLMSQWYFGYVGLNYLFGSGIASKFKYVFPLFCIVGAMAKIELVWVIQDIALGLLTIPNLIAMLILWKEVKAATDEYFANPALMKR